MLATYRSAVQSVPLVEDASQAAAVARLDECLTRLRRYAARVAHQPAAASHHPSPLVPPSLPRPPAPATVPSARLASAGATEAKQESAQATPADAPASRPRVPKGLYLHGCVGSGKSMLMDMFHATAVRELGQDGVALPSRRVHFNAFMLEVHQRIHEWKRALLAAHGRDMHVSLAPERDAISAVGHRLADEALLLCFDEFQVRSPRVCAPSVPHQCA